MSYKFYAYRIDKEDWWWFAKRVREHYHKCHGLAEFVRDGIDYEKDGVVVDSFTLLDKLRDAQGGDRAVCELQLWDEGDTYLFRVLEKGHFFENTLDNVWPIEPVTYVDTTGVPDEMAPNKKVADWANQQIEEGKYLIYEVLSWDDLKDSVTDTFMENTEV